MNEAKLKAKLERALHKPVGAISPPVWKLLIEDGYIGDYLRGSGGPNPREAWEELKYFASKYLRLQEDIDLYRSGAYVEETEEKAGGETFSSQPDKAEIVPKGLSNRTKARAQALSELSALRTGKYDEILQIRPIRPTVRMRRDPAGVSGRWEVRLEIEGWVPPEDVARVHRNIQRQILEEEGSKTEEGTFELARFVWREQSLNGGKRPKWPILFERWNQQHPDRRFKTFNGFRQCCVRGMEATKPRYKEFPKLKPPPEEVRQKRRETEERIKAMLDKMAEETENAPVFE